MEASTDIEDLRGSYRNNIFQGVFVGAFDIGNILKEAARAASKELKFKDFSFYRVDEASRRLFAVDYVLENKSLLFEKIFKKRFKSLSTSIDPPENLMGKTVKYRRVYRSPRLADFIVPAVSRIEAYAIEKVFPEITMCVSAPCCVGEQVFGAILTSFYKNLPETKENIAKFIWLADEMGLAMANAAAHERVIERFKRLYTQRGQKRDPEKADIKFTLRITQKIEKYLAWKTQNTELSKADYLRDKIEEEMAKDPEFKKLIGETEKDLEQ